MPDVRIDVYADTHGAPKNLKDVETSLDKVEKGAGLADKAFGGLTKQFISGQLAVQILNKTYAVLKDLVFDSIKGAIDEEKAEKALQGALEVTGRSVQGNLGHYLKFAEAQSKVTLYTHEQIQESQALLLTFGKLNQEGIDKATKAAMGLASVMGIDLQSATKLVEKAMIGEYAAINRAGIKIDENLTTGKKWASFLEQSEKLYQRSTKEVDTFGGEIDQLKKAFNEAEETIGKIITGSDTLKKSLVLLKGAVEDLNTITSAGGKNFIDILADKIPIIGNLTSTLDLLAMALHLEAAKVTYNENVYNGLTIALKTYDKILMNLGIDVEKITNGWIKHAKAVDQVGDALPPLVGKLKETIVPMDRAKLASGALQLALQTLGLTGLQLGESFVPAARNLERLAVIGANVGLKLGESLVPAERNLDKLAAKMGFTSFRWTESMKKMKEETKKTWDNIFACIDVAVGAINNAIQQGANARTTILNNEYQTQLNNIKKSTMNEEEKNKAIEGLDAEFDIKRRALQHKLAVQAKTTSIAMAIINTAEAVTKALAYAPPPFNIILAAISSAAGLLQIALIKAQPIPLAAGAIFKRPVFSPRGDYVAGDAGPEAVIPLSEMPRLIRELGGGGGRDYRTERPIIIQNHIFLDSREMKSFTTRTVRESGRLGLLGIVGKEMA